MSRSNRSIHRFAVRFAAIAIAAAAMSASAGVCKIGNTEYDTLQEAFNSKTSASADFTVTLLQNIDVASSITVPAFNQHVCTIDGDGRYAIRQAFAGIMFSAKTAAHFTYITFKDVTILGGGDDYAVTDVHGVFFRPYSSASILTIDSGCIVSNFVGTSSSLIGAADNYPNWEIRVNPGAVFACNRITMLFKMADTSSGVLKISGGEFYGNKQIAKLSALGGGRTPNKPIMVMTGGSFHNNTATKLFHCDYGPLDVEMRGGEIFCNDAMVFHMARGGQYLSRLHLSGGKIFCNHRAVQIDQTNSVSVLLSGDAVATGEYTAATPGIFIGSEFVFPGRVALEGDFRGFATISGNYSGTYRNVGCVYGTNLNFYAGAENIHLSYGATTFLQTTNTTGELIIRQPPPAKIGETEYATFAEALNAATDGATITLLYDCIIRNTSIVPPANKAITVDGAGHRIFRIGAAPLVNASKAGGNMTFTNVELNEGYFVHGDSFSNHVDGVIVRTQPGVAATVTLGPGTVLSGGRGTNALVRVANGATVNLDGCVITGAVNRAVAASAGGTLGVKGATLVKDNAGGDIDVEDGNILALNGNLTGCLHVTVAGAEAFDGQKFGTKTGDWTGEGNFVNGGNDPKLHVSTSGILAWCRRGAMVILR